MYSQNDLEYAKDQMDQGKMTADQANVFLVKSARFEIVRRSMQRQLRAALNNAVKSGELGHRKKTKDRPEYYYHPSFEYLAIAEINRIKREELNILKKICI